jgi:hypothetical protein
VTITAAACSRTHFHVDRLPLPAEQVAAIDTPTARTSLSVQVSDFRVRDDTECPPDERAKLREVLGTELANELQVALGSQGVFRRVVRTQRPNPADTDLMVDGDYVFFGRFGPGPKGHIPWYGRFATINTAWTRERVIVRVTNTSGALVWSGEFEDEHRQLRRPVQEAPWVPYMTQDFVSRMATRTSQEVLAHKERAR